MCLACAWQFRFVWLLRSAPLALASPLFWCCPCTCLSSQPELSVCVLPVCSTCASLLLIVRFCACLCLPVLVLTACALPAPALASAAYGPLFRVLSSLSNIACLRGRSLSSQTAACAFGVCPLPTTRACLPCLGRVLALMRCVQCDPFAILLHCRPSQRRRRAWRSTGFPLTSAFFSSSKCP